MPSKRRKDSIPAFDYREVLEITSTQDCQIVVISPETYQLCCSALRLAEYPTRWRNLVDLEDNPVNIETAIGLYHQAVKELTMGCDLEGFNSELNRIANSLESIDAKMATRITYDEIIEDLETTLGIGNSFVALVKFIGDLIPNVRLKLDMSWLPMAVWEYFTWKAPIIALLTGANASLGGMAAAALAAAPLGIIKTVTAVMDTITNVSGKLHDFWLGDWNWMDDVLTPIWNSFISDGEGGTGGDDPDGDPDKRISVDINQTNIDNNTFSPTINVSCASCGGSAGSCGCGSGQDGPYAVDPSASDGQPSPAEPPADWDGDSTGYFTYKCQAANVLVLNYAEYLAQVRSADSATPSALGPIPQAILDWIGNKISAAQSAIGPIQQWAIRKIALAVGLFYNLPEYPATGDVELTAMAAFGELRLAILDDREALVCDLYEAQTVSEALAAFTSRVDSWASGSSGYSSDELALIDEVSKAVLTNYWLNRIFTLNAGVSGYSDSSAVDCSACDECLTGGDLQGIVISDEVVGLVRTVVIEGVFESVPDPDLQARAAIIFDCCMTVIEVTVEAGAWSSYSDSAASDYYGFDEACPGGSAVRFFSPTALDGITHKSFALYSSTDCTWRVSFHT